MTFKGYINLRIYIIFSQTLETSYQIIHSVEIAEISVTQILRESEINFWQI